MRDWAKRFLAPNPCTQEAKALNEALDWYSTSFRKLSGDIIQPKTRDTCYGADADPLQAKKSHNIRQINREKLPRYIWRPASDAESFIIFVDPSYSLLSMGNLMDHPFFATAIPSAMQVLERRPYCVHGKKEVRYEWSDLRSAVIKQDDKEFTHYLLKPEQVIYAAHEPIPSWAKQRRAEVLLSG